MRQSRPPFGAGLVADLLYEQEVLAVCSPALLGTPLRGLSPEDVDHFTLLNDAHDLWPEFIERALGRSAASTAKRVSFSQTSLAIEAAVAGQGLALASRLFVEQDTEARRLVQAFAPTMRGRLGSYVVTLRKPRHPKPTEAVRQWLLGQRRPLPLDLPPTSAATGSVIQDGRQGCELTRCKGGRSCLRRAARRRAPVFVPRSLSVQRRGSQATG